MRPARLAATLAIAAMALPTVWLHQSRPELSWEEKLTIVPLAAPAAALSAAEGRMRHVGTWELDSPHFDFGGYSALASLPRGKLLAVSDRGLTLFFRAPPALPIAPRFSHVGERKRDKRAVDVEAYQRRPDGTAWVALEGQNAIWRLTPEGQIDGRARPVGMADWGANTGPESLVRLSDGRFITVSEGRMTPFDGPPPGLLFPGDPVEGAQPIQFDVDLPGGYRVTDAIALPDGRVLFLLRGLAWPYPPRFDSALAIGDPALIREGEAWPVDLLARLDDVVPQENYEGLALVPGGNGVLRLWLISDDNNAQAQRTLLSALDWSPGAPR